MRHYAAFILSVLISLVLASCEGTDADTTETPSGSTTENPSGSTENPSGSTTENPSENPSGSTENPSGSTTENPSENPSGTTTENPNKKRNVSGSRIIFKEYKLADGSIWYDPYPFDTKYNSYCTVGRPYSGLEDCCINSAIQSSYGRQYFKDQECSIPIEGVTTLISHSVSYVHVANTAINSGDVGNFLISESKYYRIASIDTSADIVYYDQYNPILDTHSCLSTNLSDTTRIATLEELSVEEARSMFVCGKD